MKKAIWLTGFLCACCLLTGCKKFSPEVTGISINDKNVVTEVIRENFENSEYSAEELSEQISDEITLYNQKAGAKCVKSSKLKVKDGVATVTLTFASPKDFASFNNSVLYLGDVDGAIQAGYTFQGKYNSVSKGAIKDEGIWGSNLMSQNLNLKVIVIAEPLLVSVPGTVKYVSEGAKVTGSSEVVSETSELTYILYE